MGHTAPTTPRTVKRYAVALLVLAAIVGTVTYRQVSSSVEVVQGHDSAASDGTVPAGVTVFDEEHPGVTNLDPELLRALRAAAKDAADNDIEFFVNSGWRSPEYQERLLREAVDKYGSLREASRWVATPDKSAHVSGDAVDLGKSDARAWLAKHGAAYGLCQIYRNEPWHYELRPDAVDDGCPRRYADPTRDPRTR
ncbi:M15 family metallopeptidase [Kribbella italica]|uniref:LAS superfamily LD-carboxypeptidase LdcB n=1 Tax=Kribbella italica TaxID=1540520 RepID=A0A7W9J4N9_9ACTN|nr:M15 family metallopeptidase [Kribbella italica]MBB5835571.1 LAS superfamily LD-carboxypeptidase LdcB [Kribbella italica]